MSVAEIIQIEPVENGPGLAEARALIRAHIEAHSEAHDAASTAELLATLPAPYLRPSGGLWLAWEGTEAAGCIALQPLDRRTAEIKRMYVRPGSRGRGIARALAERAIAEARARKYERVRLGTLTTMRAAQKLYASLGFRPIAPYRQIEFGDTLFYELKIEAP